MTIKTKIILKNNEIYLINKKKSFYYGYQIYQYISIYIYVYIQFSEINIPIFGLLSILNLNMKKKTHPNYISIINLNIELGATLT